MSNPSAARETQVNRQKGELTSSIEILDKALAALEDRLTPVLTPEAASDTKAEAAPEANLVPLASFLRAKRRSIAGLTNGIESISQRLEL